MSLIGAALTVDPTHAAFQHLALGQQQTIQVSYLISDGHTGGTVAQTATISISGTNDVPTVAGSVVASQAEGTGSLTVDLLQGALDKDSGETATLKVVGLSALPEGLSLGADGHSVMVDANHAAFSSLRAGEPKVIALSYAVEDVHGAQVLQAATITIVGTNDQPLISGSKTGIVVEDNLLSTGGTLMLVDTDTGESRFQEVAADDLRQQYGSFDFDAATGAWSFILDRAAAQSLQAGEQVRQMLTVTSFDGTVQETIAVTVVGTNDDAGIPTTPTGSVAEDGLTTASGSLVFTDVDLKDEHEVLVAAPADGTLGTLTATKVADTIAGTGGSITWSYVVDNSLLQHLKEGETKVEIFTVELFDGISTVTRTVSVTINGANDAPVVAVSNSSASGVEDRIITGQVPIGTDVDGDDLTYRLVSPVAGLALNSDGTFTYTPEANFYGTISFRYQVVDAVGDKSEAMTFTLNVTPVNDAPSDIVLSNATVAENSVAGVVGSLSAVDVDGGQLSFTLLDDADGRFGLSSDGKSLIVANGALLDFEQATSHQVGVRVTDSQGASLDQFFTISLTDVLNETISGSSSDDRMVGGQGSDTLAGGAGKDILSSGNGNDRLDGGAGYDRINGGYGKDILRGGAGKDAFLFTDKLSKTGNLDTISDFSTKDDSIWLDNAIFKKLGKGSESKPVKLNKKFFSLDKAKDKDDYIVYSKKTGLVSYDADGSGKGKAIEFVQVKKGLNLKYDDFFVI